MAVNCKKCFRTYENETFDSKVTIVTDEDDDQSDYEEIAECVEILSVEKNNQNKYTDWNKRDTSKSKNAENKSKVNGNRTESKQDFDLKLPSIIQKVKPVKFVSKTWRTACVLSAFLCVGLMSVIGVLLWLMLSTKVSPCELVHCFNDGNCSVSGEIAICTCHTGFGGLRCEGSPCDNYSCGNGGTCFLDEFQPKCACRNGFTGDNCTITPCSRSPCEHAGSCSVAGSIFSCSCLNGFTGIQCEIYEADFENDVGSMFIQDLNDEHNWRIHSNSTSSIGTGPSSAYTGDNYLYFEATSVTQGSVARFLSRDFIFESSGCLKFHYHMYGSAMGTLNVYQGSRRIWRKAGNQGNQWRLVEISLQANNFSSSNISFEAVRGSGYKSDIAIDDVQVLLSGC
ncbi:uncharacterized protein LOC143077548 isoform X1 [Mytilus galloprovincialis]|uniref:uncharacterized protein LOC143077548 isoform X1 n=1 Tax=Mytilus galloprovincialis TaxID=29158 RepID=UPI003F7C3486